MTITLTPISHGNLCHGNRWVVDDVDILAERIARVALAQYRHVARILEGLNVDAPKNVKDLANDAKSKMKVAANGDPWQRDGWIFQTISWIAAHQIKTSNTVIAAPHIFHAHKGFDGLHLDVSKDGKSVHKIVICEDKATTNSRSTIKTEVWPAINEFEGGSRVAELAHEATGLLEAHQRAFPILDVDDAIDRIIWQEARLYRVCVTTGSKHHADANRARLFKGYDMQASGDVVRRRAETMHFDDMRKWMNDLSQKVIDKIDEIANV